ncbi:MAG: thioredoxin [Ruminiclostridium sp.]|nr:thioredoxin [Ruminococcus sp.]MBR1831749.1 thioredoxin [Ruminiclostridium sp.]
MIVRCAALAASAVLIIAGIYNGGANVVLSKAITICTECIGLG